MATVNPFEQAAVADPFADPFTVPAEAPAADAGTTQQLLRLLDEVRRGHRSTSVLLLLPPDSGKKYLLVRLYRHARAIGSLLVYLPLGPKPAEAIYGSCLCSLAQRSRAGDDSLMHLLRRACRQAGDSVERALAELAGEIGLDRGLAAVLLRYPSLDPQRQELLLSWLCGAGLAPPRLAELGARAPLHGEMQARAVLKTLALLSLSGPPLILVVDRLESCIKDAGGVATLGHFLADLRNALPNTLFVSLCAADVWRDRLAAALPRAHRDRLAEHCYDLLPDPVLIEFEAPPQDPVLEQPLRPPSAPLRKRPAAPLEDFEEPSLVLSDFDDLLMGVPEAVPDGPQLRTGPMRSQPILPLAMAPAAPPPLSQGWQQAGQEGQKQQEKMKMPGIWREKE